MSSLRNSLADAADDNAALSSPTSPSLAPHSGKDSPNDEEDHPSDEDDAAPDLPLTMMASTMLLALPHDATAALAAAGGFARDKVVVRFKAVGAPPLARNTTDVRRKITATQKFDAVVAYVRRALKLGPTESVFLYVNSTFAPALDEIVGNLHQCFKDANDQLNVSYSLTPAFG